MLAGRLSKKVKEVLEGVVLVCNKAPPCTASPSGPIKEGPNLVFSIYPSNTPLRTSILPLLVPV
jgi:hypothetical protein